MAHRRKQLAAQLNLNNYTNGASASIPLLM
jgi:hypothetical protein